MEKIPDKVKDRLIKLKNLAEQGYKGEAIAAKRALEEMLNKYGMTIEDLLNEKPEWRWIKVGRDKHLKKILHQCHFQVIDKSKSTYKEYDTSIAYELTSSQYADLMSLYEFHVAQFNIERKKIVDNIADAYIQKHEIWNKTTCECEDCEDQTKEPIDIDKIKAILALSNTMEDICYHKQIESI